MTSRTQKDRERWQVEAFLKCLPQAPTGICAASETPDFLVGKVGIELTEIFQGGGGSGGSRTRRQESVYERICSRARGQHDSETHPLRVSVDFREGYLPGKGGIDRLAKELADIVARNIPSGCSTTVWEDDLPHEFTRVTIRRSVAPHPDVARWEPSGVAFEQKEIANEIQEALDQKNAKASTCRQKAAEVWLLIVIGARGPSTYMTPDEPTLQTDYASEFDRTFLFHEARCLWWDLTTHRSA